MTKKLENSPDEQFDIADDVNAEVLLLELGILDRFRKKTTAPETQAVIYNVHSTHHILAVFYSGRQKAEDNGYAIFCIPKSKLSAVEFHAFAKKFLNPNPSNILGIDPFSGPPTTN